MKRTLRVAAACIVGLALGYSLKAPPKLRGIYPFHVGPIFDFTGFLVGAKLLGTPRMYDLDTNLKVQQEISGRTAKGVLYARPPLWAAMVKPFTWMPYPAALQLARILAIAGLVAFAWLWPMSPRRYVAIALCCFPPAWGVVMHGQDLPLVLLLTTLAVLWHRDRPALAGVALALCFAKWHLLIFVPLLLLGRERRRMLYGFLGAAACLIVASFAVMPDWIQVYYHGMTSMPASSFNGRPSMMPNLYAVFYPFGWGQLAATVSVPVIGLLLWFIRRLPFDLALPVFVFGGVLASAHANDGDMVLAIPAMLAAMKYAPRARAWAVVALSPVAFVGYFLNPIVFIAPCVYGMALAASTCRRAAKRSNQPEAMICATPFVV